MVRIFDLVRKLFSGFSSKDNASLEPYHYDSDSARLRRAILNWALYEGYAYKSTFATADSFKKAFAPYKYIRSIYNPVSRIGHFYGDRLYIGETLEQALPINVRTNRYSKLTEDIYTVLNWSKFLTFKNTIGSIASIQGDIFLQVHLDEIDEVWKLRTIRSDYVIEYLSDPFKDLERVILRAPSIVEYGIYFEELIKVNNSVKLRTFKNDYPSADSTISSKSTSIPSTFIPVTHIPYKSEGVIFGSSEIKNELELFIELNSIASMLSDFIAKSVNSPWFFSGVRNSSRLDNQEIVIDNKESVPAIYARDPSASAQALLSNLNIEAVNQTVGMVIANLEQTFPELRLAKGMDRSSGDLSGRALKVSRQEAEDKLLSVRPSFDYGLYKAISQLLILNSGKNGIDKYESINPLELLFDVSDRPVFELSMAEKLENASVEMAVISAGLANGMPIELLLKKLGWKADDITEYVNSTEYKEFQNRASMESSFQGVFAPARINDNAPFEDGEQDQ